MITKPEHIKRLYLDLEGVGRSNLSKVADSLEGEKDAAGVNRPKSGRTTVHPKVVEMAFQKMNEDISNWPIQQLQPSMIDQNTLVIALLPEIELIPEYVRRLALDVFLAPIFDPAEHMHVLSYTWMQICHINWLVEYILTHDFEKVGVNRDEFGFVIPRDLASFESTHIEPKFQLTNILLPPQFNSVGEVIWNRAFIEGKKPATQFADDRVNSFNRIEQMSDRRKSFFEDDWGEGSVLRTGSVLGRY